MKYCFLRNLWARRIWKQFCHIWLMNKFSLHCRRYHLCSIIRWNKPKDKGNQEVILLAIGHAVSAKHSLQCRIVQSFTCWVLLAVWKNYLPLAEKDFLKRKRNWVTCYVCMAQGLDRPQSMSQWSIVFVSHPMPWLV